MSQTKTDSPAVRQALLAPDDGLFELAGAKPAWIWAHTCPMPECACRTAVILATDKGRGHLLERVASIRDTYSAKGDYAAVAATFDDLVAFDLDIDTAHVYSPGDGKPVDLAANPRIADVAQRIDGDLLDALGKLWYRGKGRADPEQEALVPAEIRIKGWKRGGLLAWNDVLTGVREDVYVIDGRFYEAMDLYCPAPGCDCGEVLVHFETKVPRGAPSPGTVVVQASGATERRPGKGGATRLEELWTAFLQRHPNHRERFARRYPTMKRLGERIVDNTPAVSSKTGRNDACPCGSGKKFKKCCGAN